MMQAWKTAQLIDYLEGSLPAEEQLILEQALTVSADLQQELKEVRILKDKVQTLPDPHLSSAAIDRFDVFLDQAIEASPKENIRKLWYRRLNIAASIAILFSIGLYAYLHISHVQSLEKDLMATRTLMLELMQQDRSSARIKAANLTFKLSETDQEIVDNLSHLLLYDPDTNVRLAALDALGNFKNKPPARDALLQALAVEQPEVVRFGLLNLLIELKETRALPYLENWIETDSLSQPIKDLARLGRFKMI